MTGYTLFLVSYIFQGNNPVPVSVRILALILAGGIIGWNIGFGWACLVWFGLPTIVNPQGLDRDASFGAGIGLLIVASSVVGMVIPSDNTIWPMMLAGFILLTYLIYAAAQKNPATAAIFIYHFLVSSVVVIYAFAPA